jgi:hypothetical protein
MTIQDVYSLFDCNDLKEAESRALDAIIAGRVADEAFTREYYNAVKACIDARRAELNPPKKGGTISCKVSEEKRCVCVYGLQVHPISLYAGQWLRFFGVERSALKTLPAEAHMVLKFIRDNEGACSWK